MTKITNPPEKIENPLLLFREYMNLERRRIDGLSLEEHDRWNELRGRLEGVFGTLEGGESTPHRERRATPRVPTQLEVQFENDQAIGSMLMTNLSRGGLFIPTYSPLPIGSELKLRIRIDDPETEIVVVGEVASHNLGPRLEMARAGMGIRFKGLSEADQARIDDLYERVVERHLKGQ